MTIIIFLIGRKSNSTPKATNELMVLTLMEIETPGTNIEKSGMVKVTSGLRSTWNLPNKLTGKLISTARKQKIQSC